jgi:UDP-N-acetylglucosamine 2-epimerase (non-hydrolysing)
MHKIKILIVFGTRPEAIKMAPIVKEFQKHQDKFEIRTCVTAQHREMLDQVLGFFGIKPDYDLDLMKADQGLSGLTQSVLEGVTEVIKKESPDFVYVQGDTTTSFAAALAAFYEGVRVCHVEAGLRTYNKKAPFPEELNRQLTSRIADIHFAPTESAKQNLLSEGIEENSIYVTGNTVIDALFDGLEILKKSKTEDVHLLEQLIDREKKLVLVTGHRRENFGDGFNNICKAVEKIAQDYEDEVQVIYPVHLNPNVRQPVHDLLEGIKNIKLIEPLPYPEFIWLMNQAYMILTDSGGIQEEAPSLGKPVLVMREVTERPEAVEAGTVILVGTDFDTILKEIRALLEEDDLYKKMSKLHNPYGDGEASSRIYEAQVNL